jgi:hypothetical protein
LVCIYIDTQPVSFSDSEREIGISSQSDLERRGALFDAGVDPLSRLAGYELWIPPPPKWRHLALSSHRTEDHSRQNGIRHWVGYLAQLFTLDSSRPTCLRSPSHGKSRYRAMGLQPEVGVGTYCTPYAAIRHLTLSGEQYDSTTHLPTGSTCEAATVPVI